MEGDQDGDGKLSFEEFAQMVSNTVRRSALSTFCRSLPLRIYLGHCETNDTGRFVLIVFLLASAHTA